MTHEDASQVARERDAREIRIEVPNPRSAAVRARVARSVASLSAAQEADALAWIEAVSEFDERRVQSR